MEQQKNKRIDVVVKYFYPVAAGIETNTLETYSVMINNGWDVVIHTCKDTHTQKDILADEDTVKGLPVKRYHFSRFGYWPNIDWQHTDVVALHNFDIFPHLRILLYTLYLKIMGKKNFALIVTPHGGYNPEWSIFNLIPRVVKYVYHFTVGTILVNLTTDGMRAVSEWEKAEMLKKGIRKRIVKVIDNGLEDEAFVDLEAGASTEIKEKVASWGDYIIQVGRVYKIKNYETTLRALTKVPAHIKYVIVGPNSDETYMRKLKGMIAELGLSGRVIFAGVIRGVDKYYVIKHAQMMVHMALWESFCNVVHEGLSQGLPCIVANNTALPLLIKDQVNGYCVETMDHNMVAEKINFIYENRNQPVVVDMKRINKEKGLKNSWREVAERMGIFYAAALAHVRS